VSPLQIPVTRHRGIPLHLVVLNAAIIAALLVVVIVVSVSLMVTVVVVAGVNRAMRGRHNSRWLTASSSDSRASDRRDRQKGNTEQAKALGELASCLPQEKVCLACIAVANLLQQLTVPLLSISSGSTSSNSSDARNTHGAHHAVERRYVGSWAREQSLLHLKGRSAEVLHVLLQQENIAQELMGRL
jgi:hypothetical protein